MKQLLTTKEMAKLLSISPSTLRRYARDKVVPSTLVGLRRRFDQEAVLAALNERNKYVYPDE